MDLLWFRGGEVDLLFGTSIVRPLADSYVASAAREARSVAELVESWKLRKKTNILVLQQTTFFSQLQSRLGPVSESACDFFSLLRRKLVIIPATSKRQLFVPVHFLLVQ